MFLILDNGQEALTKDIGDQSVTKPPRKLIPVDFDLKVMQN